MNSYQRRVAEIAALKAEIATLKEQLTLKGNVFFAENRSLGINRLRFGYVEAGRLMTLHEKEQLG